MILVDLHNQTPPAKWLAKAEALEKKLLAATTPRARRKLIDDNDDLWKDPELKDWLRDLSKKKCWYSEARDCCSHWHVDHFRPKNEVKDLDGNAYEGYWWLAFSWRNYRLSGAISNTVKSSKFPMADGYWCAGPRDDLEEESPYLLDPTDPADIGLITFTSNGVPQPCDDLQSLNKTRVKESIKILKLKHKYLVEARKECWQECERKVNKARNQMNRVEEGRAGAKGRLKDSLEDLRDLVNDKAPFSSVARACIYSHKLVWLNRAVGLA